MVVLEFTIEPFVDGKPGAHVNAGVAAAEALGAEVEFGPFGSTCVVTDDRAGIVIAAVVDAAIAHGATHVSFHAEVRSELNADANAEVRADG